MGGKTNGTIVTAATVTALLAGTWAIAGMASGGKARGDEASAVQPPAVTLQTAVNTVRERFGGRPVEAELEDEDGRRVYEVETMGDDGRRHEYYVDATTGRILNDSGDYDREDDD